MRVASEEERRWLCETWWEKCQESCEAVARARLVFLRQVGRLRLSLRTSEHTLPSLSPGQFFHMTVQPVIARPMMAGAIFLKYSLPCAIFLKYSLPCAIFLTLCYIPYLVPYSLPCAIFRTLCHIPYLVPYSLNIPYLVPYSLPCAIFLTLCHIPCLVPYSLNIPYLVLYSLPCALCCVMQFQGKRA